ncbi:hypothetical protein JY651_48265 [Pyxidicoccus parkwayensis]|uniref:Uncharacterized protein n=1 Tax=Pyxidicoccus parkwayensis TaxID=2813578 RepID=A0ABX7NZD0_9BACT|nr:hypothetical protein [Pyxidicoccus parkwaysis]QSQ22810.1 hypothetical protein JY651_48265 [Pyxidicoccus parkwaysis]
MDHYEVEPGGLVLLTTRHPLQVRGETFECRSYVTQGLAAHGQQEMVFTLRENTGVEEDVLHKKLASLFSRFRQLAEEGRTVDVGDVTIFGEHRLFPGMHLLYTPASPVPRLPVPSGALALLLITERELDLVQRCGPARLMSALGKAHSHYPCPSWSDLHRPELPVAAMLEQSLLPRVNHSRVWNARVVKQDGDILLRVAPGQHEQFRKLFEQLPDATQPFALLTGIDAAADGCLAWEPGQTGPVAITPPGGRAERISGCFLLVLPGMEQEEARLHEDGFIWSLSTASSKALWTALCEGQGLALLVGGRRLRVEWVAP